MLSCHICGPVVNPMVRFKLLQYASLPITKIIYELFCPQCFGGDSGQVLSRRQANVENFFRQWEGYRRMSFSITCENGRRCELSNPNFGFFDVDMFEGGTIVGHVNQQAFNLTCLKIIENISDAEKQWLEIAAHRNNF